MRNGFQKTRVKCVQCILTWMITEKQVNFKCVPALLYNLTAFVCFPDKKLLKPTAVPSLNLNLRKLTESELMDITFIDTGHERPQSVLQEADIQAESRKRISNIIIVDLTKDKKAKYPERPKVLCLHLF